MSINSFDSRGTLEVGENSYEIFRLSAVPGTEKLPYALKVLAENLLRTEDGANITTEHINALANVPREFKVSLEWAATEVRSFEGKQNEIKKAEVQAKLPATSFPAPRTLQALWAMLLPVLPVL